MVDVKVRAPLSVTLLLCALAVAGCGDSDTGVSSEGATVRVMLTDLGLLLQELQTENRPIPTSQAEMDQYEPLRPTVNLGLISGDIVYQWGAGINPAGGNTVLAYEKKAPTEGGWVLMQDGTVKQMAADEFKLAPKASR